MKSRVKMDTTHPKNYTNSTMETGETTALVASIQRGLDDIEQGRYGTFDTQAIRERVKEKIAAINN